MAQWLITACPALAPAVRLFAEIAHDFCVQFSAFLLETLGGDFLKRTLSIVLSCVLLLCCLMPCVGIRADAATEYNLTNFSGEASISATKASSYISHEYISFDAGEFPLENTLTFSYSETYSYVPALYYKLSSSSVLVPGNSYSICYKFPDVSYNHSQTLTLEHRITFVWRGTESVKLNFIYSELSGEVSCSTNFFDLSDYASDYSYDLIYSGSDVVGFFINITPLVAVDVVEIYARYEQYLGETTSSVKFDASDLRVTVGQSSSDYRFLWVKHETKSVYSTGDTVQFYADWDYSGSGEFDKSVFWSCDSSSSGTYIDSNGLLTIGPFESLSYITVTAVSVADPSIINTSTIPINDITGSLDDPSVTIPSFEDDEYTGEGAPSESRILVVTATSPQSLVYALGDEPAYMTIETSCGDIGEIEYQWYCLYTDSAGEQQTLVGSKSYNQKPVTSIPGLYEYFLVVTNTVDGEVYYGNSPTFTVNVYVPEHETDIGKLLDRIIENQVTIDGHIDDLESILQSTNENLFDSEKGFLPKILDAIKALFTGGDSQEDEQFREDAEQNRQDFEDSMGVLDDMTMPDYEDVGANDEIDGILDDENTNDGIGLASQFFEKIFSNEIIFTVFFIALTLALISFVLFGKR